MHVAGAAPISDFSEHLKCVRSGLIDFSLATRGVAVLKERMLAQVATLSAACQGLAERPVGSVQEFARPETPLHRMPLVHLSEAPEPGIGETYTARLF